MTDNSEILLKAKNTELLVLDVDGVLTGGEIIYDSSGKEIKAFHVHDGVGVAFAIRSGLKITILTGRNSRVLKLRARDMGISDVWSGWPKISVFEKMIQRYKCSPEKICFVGDDLIDRAVLKKVGFPVAVRNAVSEIKEICAYTTNAPGGKGAVREVIELILKAKGIWDTIVF